jgi:hypothetical protein
MIIQRQSRKVTRCYIGRWQPQSQNCRKSFLKVLKRNGSILDQYDKERAKEAKARSDQMQRTLSQVAGILNSLDACACKEGYFRLQV